ncbi:MAG: transposase, partial [Bacilli bacterium]
FVVGCDVSSRRKLLLVKKCHENNTRFYLEALQHLKSRGLNNIIFCQLENLPIIRKSLKIVYPNAVLIDPIELPIKAIKQYCNSSYKSAIERKYMSLYLHDTLDEYNVSKNEFNEEINQKLILLILEKYLEKIPEYYKYDVELRKVMLNHNFYITFGEKIRKILRKYDKIDNINQVLDEIVIVLTINENHRFINKKTWADLLEYIYKNIDENILESC